MLLIVLLLIGLAARIASADPEVDAIDRVEELEDLEDHADGVVYEEPEGGDDLAAELAFEIESEIEIEIESDLPEDTELGDLELPQVEPEPETAPPARRSPIGRVDLSLVWRRIEPTVSEPRDEVLVLGTWRL